MSTRGSFFPSYSIRALTKLPDLLTSDNLIELNRIGRERIFNLGYYTWVEQQGIALEDFDARRKQSFWNKLTEHVDVWDDMIREFNSEVSGN